MAVYYLMDEVASPLPLYAPRYHVPSHSNRFKPGAVCSPPVAYEIRSTSRQLLLFTAERPMVPLSFTTCSKDVVDEGFVDKSSLRGQVQVCSGTDFRRLWTSEASQGTPCVEAPPTSMKRKDPCGCFNLPPLQKEFEKGQIWLGGG